MGLDIRIPIGLMFGTLGLLLAFAGILMDHSAYQRSLGINVNLWWGLVLLAFGLLMFFFGKRGRSTAQLAENSVEGQKIEELEHRLGLESDDN